MKFDPDLVQSFFDSADAAMYLSDVEGRYVMANKLGAQKVNSTVEELVGNTVFDIIPREEADEYIAINKKVLESGKPITFKKDITLPSGKRTIAGCKFPVESEDHPNLVGGIAIDITDIDT